MVISVKILADSISPDDVRLITVEATYPRIIHSEVMTHRVFSRNAASSRAIPIQKMIQSVMNNPYIPEKWGINQKGMQSEKFLDDQIIIATSEKEWLKARDCAVEQVQKLLDLGIHKQWVNRLLEPFQWYTCIITATEWENFFNLRNHPAAHPDIQKLAKNMQEAISNSTSKKFNYGDGNWHLPLVDEWVVVAPDDEFIQKKPQEFWCKVSVGRCARVSYLTHDGKRDLQADVALHDRLLEDGHMCFDAQTEVLTRRGWTKWPNVTSSDELFAVNIDTHTGNFEKPKYLHDYELDGELYRIVGQQLDLAVTFNHRMVVSSRKNDGSWTSFGFEAAEQVKGKPRRYLKAVNYCGDNNIINKESPGFFRLLGFFIGDGYAIKGNQLKFHLKKKRKIEYLKSLGYDVNELKNNTYTIQEFGIGSWFRENCYTEDGQKKFPDWILNITEEQALELFDGLKNSDGSIRRNTWVYSTTSSQVADILQALLHIHGKVGNFMITPYSNKSIIRINISNRITPRVEISQSGRSLSYKEDIMRYTGHVYCATTSTGALLVRRNGKVVVSGNSPFEHVARPMTKSEAHSYYLTSGAYELHGSRPELAFCGNFRGWVQYRKTIPHEENILGFKNENR